MNLPIPSLDDKTFAQLMEDVTKLIPRYAPEWTDFNKHDPGITFLELFAELTEQQRYYLDQIQDSSLLKFLKLLGIQPKEATSARVEVSFSHKDAQHDSILIPQGTALIFSSPSIEDAIFEIERDFWFTSTTLKKIISFSRFEVKDQTGTSENQGLSFAAFGDRAEANSSLYLGLSDPFPTGKPTGIYFDVVDSVKRGSHGDEPIEIEQSVKLTWEYTTGNDWEPLNIIEDETFNLTQSGQLYFTLSSPMTLQPFIHLSVPLYWIRATVTGDRYEIPPQLNTIRLNTIAATQQQTFAQVMTFSSNGQQKQVFPASYLALVGETILQTRNHDGTWQDCQFSKVSVNHQTCQITLEFFKSEKPLKGRDNIRLICYLKDFREQFQSDISDGLPNQRFVYSPLPVIGEIALQIQTQDGTWEDWQLVQDLDASHPQANHYTLDSQKGIISFGDGVNGRIPLSSSRIRIISYQKSQTELGNVKAEAKIQFQKPLLIRLEDLSATNPQAATGGAIAESLEKAQLRARKQLRTPFRAVTSEDFERLALETPGLRVARAKAIPLPSVQNPNAAPFVTVVVVPYSPFEQPIPSQGFINTVKAHLNRHRLITTRIEVQPPIYIGISVTTTVLAKPGFIEADTRKAIKDKLDQVLNPLQGGDLGKGWEFGRTVYRSEIYAVIESVDAVDCVQNVILSSNTPTLISDKQGNIQLPSPQHLVYPLPHQIEVIQAAENSRLSGGRRR